MQDQERPGFDNANAGNATGEGAGRAQARGARKRTGVWGVLAGLGVVLLKFKTVLLLVLTKLKFLLVLLKFGKFLTTFGSMLLMVVVYANLFGWMYGAGFVLLLLIHEAGHYITARHVGLRVSTPVFIPFVGAFIALKEQPRSAVVEAKVALGGPVLGSIASLVCGLLYFPTGNPLFLALAYTGFMLNLFNLIPVHPLDGGRTVSAISPRLWFLGIPLLAVCAFYFFNPIIILFLILGCGQAYKYWRNPDRNYHNTPLSARLAFASVYFGVMIFLGIGMYLIHDLHAERYR
jgi:Zn-dependent protease